MTAHSSLIFADYLDKNGLANVRTTFPDFDAALTNSTNMFIQAGSTNARVSLVEDPNAPVAVVGGAIIAPGSPASPSPGPAPAPVIPRDPPPNLDPKSFVFESPTTNDGVTDLNNIYWDLTGKVPPGTQKIVGNIKGNGNTNVTVNFPGDIQGSFFKPGSDTPGGAKVWIENHASGDVLRLYSCTGLKINGVVLSVFSNTVNSNAASNTGTGSSGDGSNTGTSNTGSSNTGSSNTGSSNASSNNATSNNSAGGISMLPTTFTLVKGQKIQLNLTVDGVLTIGPTYTTSDPTIASITPNDTGVLVTSLKSGTFAIKVSGHGATDLSAESDGTVTDPLATVLGLVPGAIS